MRPISSTAEIGATGVSHSDAITVDSRSAASFDAALESSGIIISPTPGTSVDSDETLLDVNKLHAADDAWVNVVAIAEQLQENELPADQIAALRRDLQVNLASFQNYIRQIEQRLP